jgi:hypothetical protein
MHLPWGWVKQRPHFLAEHLNSYFDVDLLYRFYYVPFERKLVDNRVSSGLRVTPFPIIPLNRFGWVARINAFIVRSYLKRRISSYDIIWVTNPDMYEIVKPIIPLNTHLVYDCMDNHLEFSLIKNNRQLHHRILVAESQLMRDAQTVIASSDALSSVLIERYGVNRRIEVVNNAISLEDSCVVSIDEHIESCITRARFKLIYIGTIASWMDMDLLEAVVNANNDVTVFLFGPSETAIPIHERIIDMGPIQHCQVYQVMNQADALFMPFKVDNLILGVNPVKLYEYIYSGKPSFSVRYPETEKFDDYVYLYSDTEEFLVLLKKLLTGELGAKQPIELCSRFAKENTWEHRAKNVAEILGM